MADLSQYSTSQLEAMLAKLKAEKEKKRTGSTLSVDEIRKAQQRINKQETKIPSNRKFFGSKRNTQQPRSVDSVD